MPNADFEERLNRIQAGAGDEAAPPAARPQTPNIRPGRFAIACLIFMAGWQMIKLANSQYDAIRDLYGSPAAAGLGLGSFALVILGVVMMFGALRAAPSMTKAVQSSLAARLVLATLGLGLGGLAAFFIYVGTAGRQLGVTGQVSVETAKGMATGSTIAAVLLVALALMIGFVGLFVRGLPMRRVPVFALLGALLLFTGFQTFRIHPSDWPVFMAEFTAAFTNQVPN